MIKTLIVEDDFRIADIHEEFLEKVDGVNVVGKATTGKEAFKLIKELKVDLLLLDIYLPDYLGTNLIQEIRELKPSIDIIVITAAKDKKFLEKSLRSGVFSYLIKPLSMERFTEVLKDYNQRKRLLEEKEYVDQDTLDEIFTTNSGKKQTRELLPKGIDRITLRNVKKTMEQNGKRLWTAEEMGKQMGSSRTTARRYLEFLVSSEYVEVEQEYGVIGRPERKYHLTDK